MAAPHETNPKENANERNPCLRLVVAGHHQLGHLHHLRLQLRQAADEARLALLQIGRIRRRTQMSETPAYGLWSLVIINSAIFIIFAFSFAKPQTKRDWRSFGAFSAFLVALFTEMYGFPLTIYLLSGWLTSKFPDVNWLAHDSGHLLEMIFGWKSNPHFGPFHILSTAFIFAGFILLSASWKVLYAAQKGHRLALTGPYAKIRHPQYAGFVLIMFGFLLQWPTLITLVMFPILVFMYVRLAYREEREVAAEFGEAYERYRARTPAFFPKLGDLTTGGSREARH